MTRLVAQQKTLAAAVSLFLVIIVVGCGQELGEPTSSLVLLPSDVFLDIRTRIEGNDPSTKAAADSLRAIAEAQLAVPIVTPLDKRATPPSGDKHDYVSRAPYFWPNPDTPDGLPYVKRDGEVYEENRTGTDFVARNTMEETVLILAQAYYFLGDERYAARAVAQIRAWFLDPETQMNPHLEYSQGVPGIMEGSEWGTIDMWRWSVMLDTIRLLDPSPSWSTTDRDSLAHWLLRYSEWLEDSELGTRAGLMWNNHGTFLDAQRAAIALYAGDSESARDILERAWHVRIDHGIEGDGRQRYELERTRSFGYSSFNLRAYYTLAALAESVGVDLWNRVAEDGSGLAAATRFLANYTDPAQDWPYLDIRFDRADLLPVLRWAYVAYEDEEWLEAARRLPDYTRVASAWPGRNVDLYHAFLPR